jgi:hypothetical protein
VTVVHPREQRARLVGVRAWHGQLRLLELMRDRADALEHRAEVRHGATYVVERVAHPLLELARVRLVARPVDLHHLPGLGLDPAAIAADRLDHAACVASNAEHGVHDEVHADVHLAEHDADGIHEEGHVRPDHAQQRAMRRGGRFGIQGRSEIDEDPLGGPLTTELEVGEGGGGQIPGTVRSQILFGHAAEECAQEVRGQGARVLRDVTRGARDYLFDERESRCGNLAKHRGESLRKVRGRGARL